MHSIYQADIFSALHSLINSIGTLAAFSAIIVLGVMAMVEIGRGKVGQAVALVFAAIIPLWFLFDPISAENAFKAATNNLH
ncbi:MAG: hypothetical protein FWD04_12730 [Conexibacteraceae bacterium]|nr:hypothetical protein [Conexibacteraceae bacterium]